MKDMLGYMAKTKVAKLFWNGETQEVRLPAEFAFAGKQVYATRDEQSGDVVLSDREGAAAWREFFELPDGPTVSND